MTETGHPTVRVETLVLHTQQPARLASFWCRLLGYVVAPNYTGSVQLRDPAGQNPPLLIAHSSAPATDGSLHLDLRPDDQPELVALALSLGATRLDGGEESWVVLADPDGNRFCVLQSADAYEAWRRVTTQPYSKSM